MLSEKAVGVLVREGDGAKVGVDLRTSVLGLESTAAITCEGADPVVSFLEEVNFTPLLVIK